MFKSKFQQRFVPVAWKALRRWTVGAAFVLGVSMTGCGGAGHDLQLVPVSGTVTYKGKPVSGAQVTFHFAKETAGMPRVPNGTTDEAGNFKLTTINTNDGAVPGDYIVTFFKAKETGQEPEIEIGGDAYSAAMQAVAEGKYEASIKSTIPEKYGDPEKSPEKRTVVAEGENVFKFELTD